MKAFEYVGATSVDQAVKALTPGSSAMAGGTRSDEPDEGLCDQS